MARSCTGFRVKKCRRKSGSTYWLVSGSLLGRQLKREFAGYEEADQWRQDRENELHGGGKEHSNLGRQQTTLTPAQLRDAEVACFRASKANVSTLTEAVDFYGEFAPVLAGSRNARMAELFRRIGEQAPGWTLEKVCEYFLTTHRQSRDPVKVSLALTLYRAELEDLFSNRNLSWWQKVSIERALKRFEKWLKSKAGEDLVIEQVTELTITEYLNYRLPAGQGYSPKTLTNYRSYLLGFFNFCIEQHWVEHNPVERARGKKLRGKKARGVAEILPPEKVAKLMAWAEKTEGGSMVPFFALCTFCGLRPTMREGEISRLLPEHINLGERIIHLPQDKTKTGQTRRITLNANVVQWLQAYPLNRHPIKPRGYYRLYAEAKRAVGGWGHNALRHSYCTYLAFLPGMSVRDAALQAGNSEAMMLKHYLNLDVKKESVSAFWSITPRLGSDQSNGISTSSSEGPLPLPTPEHGVRSSAQTAG